jgi:hypothetical protein
MGVVEGTGYFFGVYGSLRRFALEARLLRASEGILHLDWGRGRCGDWILAVLGVSRFFACRLESLRCWTQSTFLQVGCLRDKIAHEEILQRSQL